MEKKYKFCPAITLCNQYDIVQYGEAALQALVPKSKNVLDIV